MACYTEQSLLNTLDWKCILFRDLKVMQIMNFMSMLRVYTVVSRISMSIFFRLKELMIHLNRIEGSWFLHSLSFGSKGCQTKPNDKNPKVAGNQTSRNGRDVVLRHWLDQNSKRSLQVIRWEDWSVMIMKTNRKEEQNTKNHSLWEPYSPSTSSESKAWSWFGISDLFCLNRKDKSIRRILWEDNSIFDVELILHDSFSVRQEKEAFETMIQFLWLLSQK